MVKRSRKQLIDKGVIALSLGITAGCLAVIAFLIFGIRVKETHDNRTLYRPMVRRIARRHGLDPALVMAVIKRESNFDPDVRGADGEYGLMQVTRGAASDWERLTRRTIGNDNDLFNPELNIEVGSWYLARGWRRFDRHPDQLILALSQYNAGPSRAEKWAKKYKENLLEQIPISSTRRYITKVRSYYEDFLLED